MAGSLLRSSFRLGARHSAISRFFNAGRRSASGYTYNSEGYKHRLHHNPHSDLVAEITLPAGTHTLEFARFPIFPGTSEPCTSCLLWGETKAALLANNFEPSPMPTPSRRGMYFFGPSTVAGTGVFAQEDIECGETVIIERPFVMAVASVPEKNLPDLSPLQSMAFEAMDFFVAERLSTSDRRDFFSHVSSDNSPYQIMSQNSIPVSESLPGPYSGSHSIICRDISRINHSCTPNVDLTWDPSSFSVSIHSSSRISKGEELLRSYGDFLLPRSNRMEWMSNVYDFKCTCPSCSLPDKESHKSDVIRRFLMKDLSKIIRTVSSDEGGEMVDLDFDAWLSDPSLPDDYFTSRCENVLGLMHRDGATNLGLCAIYYTRLMRAYVVLADEEKARHWASKAMDIMHPVFAEVREYASGILARQRDEEWGIRKRLS